MRAKNQLKCQKRKRSLTHGEVRHAVRVEEHHILIMNRSFLTS